MKNIILCSLVIAASAITTHQTPTMVKGGKVAANGKWIPEHYSGDDDD